MSNSEPSALAICLEHFIFLKLASGGVWHNGWKSKQAIFWLVMIWSFYFSYLLKIWNRPWNLRLLVYTWRWPWPELDNSSNLLYRVNPWKSELCRYICKKIKNGFGFVMVDTTWDCNFSVYLSEYIYPADGHQIFLQTDLYQLRRNVCWDPFLYVSLFLEFPALYQNFLAIFFEPFPIMSIIFSVAITT